jgi:hypothetical protein
MKQLEENMQKMVAEEGFQSQVSQTMDKLKQKPQESDPMDQMMEELEKLMGSGDFENGYCGN